MKIMTGSVHPGLLLILTALSYGPGACSAAFSFWDHPLYELAHDPSPPIPVILHKYAFRDGGSTYNGEGEASETSEGGIFVPGGATYYFQGTQDLFCEAADVLITNEDINMRNGRNDEIFATAELNRPARVFVLLGLSDDANEDDNIEIEGAPSNWGLATAVTHVSNLDPIPFGDPERWLSEDNHSEYTQQPRLRRHAVVAEILDPGVSIVVPHRRTLSVLGKTVREIALLFTPIDADLDSYPLTGHEAPHVPSSFASSQTPLPNEKCPSWLHDLYVVQDRVDQNTFWQTWHPIIDPIYWCYFDHEHGGCPGRFYKPMFHYTAYHTPDPTSPTGRQNESHNGFKVFPFREDDGRDVVITLHIHMSQARRFYARHHTFIVAVLDSAGEIELEFHMKMDYGFAKARFAQGSSGPFTPEGFAIEAELDEMGQDANRNIAIFNDAQFKPGIIDEDEGLPGGRYESWRGIMNCGRNLGLASKSSLKWELHDPQSGMAYHDSTAADNIQKMEGDGMARSIVFVSGHNLQIAEEHCQFDGFDVADRSAEGVFYTNAYFNATLPAADEGDWALRQFMAPNFQPLTINAGGHRCVSCVDPWNAVMKLVSNPIGPRRFSNTEMAVRIYEN